MDDEMKATESGPEDRVLKPGDAAIVFRSGKGGKMDVHLLFPEGISGKDVAENNVPDTVHAAFEALNAFIEQNDRRNSRGQR